MRGAGGSMNDGGSMNERSDDMHGFDRRQWLRNTGLGVLGLGVTRAAGAADDAVCAPKDGKLLLQDFRPRSMLHVAETRVQKPRHPVIDVHSHLTWTTQA